MNAIVDTLILMVTGVAQLVWFTLKAAYFAVVFALVSMLWVGFAGIGPAIFNLK